MAMPILILFFSIFFSYSNIAASDAHIFGFVDERCSDFLSGYESITGFSDNSLSEIKSGAQKIIRRTRRDDFVIYLGRSPLWFYRANQFISKRKNSLAVAFSGQPYSDDYAYPTRHQVLAYRKYLDQIGVTPSFIANNPGRFVIVDNVSTGKSIAGFIRVLQDWAKEIEVNPNLITNKLVIINLTYKYLTTMMRNDFEFKDQIQNIFFDSRFITKLTNATHEISMGFYFPY